MSETDPQEEQESCGKEPEHVGAMSDEEWRRLLQHADSLVAEMEGLPYPEVKEKVFELLSAVDRIHREPLWRLASVLKKGVLEKLVEDPLIRTLMELYDLVPPAENMPDARAPAGPKTHFPDIPVRVVHETPKRSDPEPPHWVPAPVRRDDLAAGEFRELTLDGRQVLLCRSADELYAVEANCCLDGSSLGEATLNGFTLSCGAHAGCRYDIRGGNRLDAPGQIASYPVNVEPNGRVLLGFGTGFLRWQA